MNISINNLSSCDKNIEIIINPVGFYAVRGHISLGSITPHSFFNLIQYYKYSKVPLTGSDIDPLVCDLDFVINVDSNSYHFDSVIKTSHLNHEILWEDEPRIFPSSPPLIGVKPPNINLNIHADNSVLVSFYD